MSLPFDYQKEFCWLALRNDKSIEEDFLRLGVQELLRVRASEVEVQGNRILFKVAMFRWVTRWNLLAAINQGFIEIRRSAGMLCVTYYLSFTRQLLISGVVFSVFLTVIFSHDPRPTGILNLSGPLLVVLVVIGFNFLATILRFSKFVKKIVEQAVAASGTQ